jgi:hypothetical protein
MRNRKHVGQWHRLHGVSRRMVARLLMDRPGPQSAAWAAHRDWGDVWVDDVRRPNAAVCGITFNYELIGRLDDDSPHLATLPALPISRGIYCRPLSELTLRAAFHHLPVSHWPVFRWPSGRRALTPKLPKGYRLHRLGAGDEKLFAGFEHQWLCKCYGSPAGLCCHGIAWAVVHRGRLASLADVFTCGPRYADIGVGTQGEHRTRGLALACCSRLIAELLEIGVEPSWTTQPENPASIHLARALGFEPAGAICIILLPARLPDREVYHFALA